MKSYIVVSVDPNARRWVDMEKGYLVLGELLIDETRINRENALPKDNDVSFIEVDTGVVYRVHDKTVYDTGDSVLSLLGHADIAEATAKHKTVRLCFDWTSHKTYSERTSHLMMSVGFPFPSWTREAMERDQGLNFNSQTIIHLISRAVLMTSGRAGQIQVRDLLPNLRVA